MSRTVKSGWRCRVDGAQSVTFRAGSSQSEELTQSEGGHVSKRLLVVHLTRGARIAELAELQRHTAGNSRAITKDYSTAGGVPSYL